MNASRLFLALALLGALSGAATAQLANGGFETNFGVPAGWTTNGVGAPGATIFADADMPTEGSFFLSFFASLGGPATPHSNPGGAGVDATGTAQLSQTFTVPNDSDTLLAFDCQFVSLDSVNGDFLEVSVSDGTTVFNLVHLDISDTPGGTPSSISGSTNTAVNAVTADLGALYPTATPATVFTLTLHVGNLNSPLTGSRGYFDNFRFEPGTIFDVDRVDFVDLGATHRIDVHTVQPFREFYHLISNNTSGPVGAGPLLGLHLDVLPFEILATPFGTPGLHTGTGPTGDYFTFINSLAVPSGTTFDYMLAVVNAGALESQSSVKRYVWP